MSEQKRKGPKEDPILFSSEAEDLSKMEDMPERLRGRVFTNSAHVESAGGMKKVARIREHEFFCDEPPIVGGNDEYPQPLGYLAASVGFCLLTQISRLASMKKKTVTKASADCEFDIMQLGSVLRGDYHSKAVEFRVHLDIESPEPAEEVRELIAMAKRSCFAEDLITNPVPLVSTVEVNGEPMELEPKDPAATGQ